MAAVAARTAPWRPLLQALVVGLILGVLALHHVAAHHGGAADSDHHAGSEPASPHDAEPAADGTEGPLSTWDAAAPLSGNDVAVDSPAGVTSEMVVVLSAQTSHPVAGKTGRLSLAVLSSVLLFPVISVVLSRSGPAPAAASTWRERPVSVIGRLRVPPRNDWLSCRFFGSRTGFVPAVASVRPRVAFVCHATDTHARLVVKPPAEVQSPKGQPHANPTTHVRRTGPVRSPRPDPRINR